MEFFSGKARISKTAFAVGYQVRAFDTDYDHPQKGRDSTFSGEQKRSCMDMNGEAGFLLLSEKDKHNNVFFW